MHETNIQHNPHDRVRNLSPEKYNQNIDRKTDQLLHGLRSQGPSVIRERLRKLDKEWDIDRAMMLISSSTIFVQLAASFKKRSKNLLWGPLILIPFLIMHSTLGWSPPLLLLRKLGFRTRFEIQQEREELLDVLSHEDPLNEWDIYGKV